MQRPDIQAISSAASAEPSPKAGPAIIVLGLALVMRFAVIWTVMAQYTPRWLFTRGMEMGLLAHSLLAGKGLASPFGGDTGPTAIVAPIYPFLVAVVFRIFGEYSTASALAILIAQTLLNLLTTWLIMRVALRLFNQTAATLAGLVWASSLPLAWMPTILWETSLSCCLLTGLFALALKYRALERIAANHWTILGGYCGIAALVNPALLPSCAAILLWLAYTASPRRMSAALTAGLTFAVVFSPWPIRNARVLHGFIPTRTTVGLELWMGNRPGSTGYLDESVFPSFNRSELADYLQRGEVAYSAHKSQLAKAYIASHPAGFIALSAKRFVRFWTGTGTQHGSWLFAAHATLTTLFSIVTLAALARRKRYEILALFGIPMLLFPLPYIITHAEFRYRLVLDPIVTIAASCAMARLWHFIFRNASEESTAHATQPFAEGAAWKAI